MIMLYDIVCTNAQAKNIKQEVKHLSKMLTCSSRSSVQYDHKLVTIKVKDGQLMDRVNAEAVLRPYMASLRQRVFNGELTEAQTVKQNGGF